MKKDINNIPKTEKEIIKKAMGVTLDRVFVKADSRLNDKQRKDLEKVFASNDDAKKISAIKKYIPDFKEMLGKEIIKTAQEFKEKLSKQQDVK